MLLIDTSEPTYSNVTGVLTHEAQHGLLGMTTARCSYDNKHADSIHSWSCACTAFMSILGLQNNCANCVACCKNLQACVVATSTQGVNPLANTS